MEKREAKALTLDIKRRLREFCAQSERPILWLDEGGRIAFCNSSFRELHGFGHPREIPGTLFEINPDLSLSEWQDRWAMLKEEGFGEWACRHLTSKGESLKLRLGCTLLESEGWAYALLWVMDQGNEGQLPAALFRRALKEAPHMVLWVSETGNILFANEGMCRQMGVRLGALLSSSVFELQGNIDAESWAHRWAELKRKGVVELDTTLRNRSGVNFSVRERAVWLSTPEGGVQCSYFTPQRAGSPPNERLQLAHLTLNLMQDPVVWVNREGQVVYGNERFRTWVGLEGKRVFDFLDEMTPKDWEKSWEGEALGRRNLLLASGEKMPVAVFCTPLQTEEEPLLAMILRDMRSFAEKESKLMRELSKVKALRKRLEADNLLLKQEFELEHQFEEIITGNERFKAVLAQLEQVARTDAIVLIEGETGTGKELLARALHRLSKRAKRPMVKVNCAALPEHLIESELFGHEKGAFTGAVSRQIGRFERADGSTLFLDEVSELPLNLQPKLLRVLQEGEFERVGGSRTIKVNVRVVAATNRSLEAEVQRGRFREDLYYRLNVFPLSPPPLRERKDDIPLLVQHFVKKYAARSGKKIETISAAVFARLQAYDFPGNVRELENLIERAVILSKGPTLRLNHILLPQKRTRSKTFKTLEQLQRDHIREALRRCNGKVSGPGGAAELLGIHHRTLASRMRKLGIKRLDYKKNS